MSYVGTIPAMSISQSTIFKPSKLTYLNQSISI